MKKKRAVKTEIQEARECVISHFTTVLETRLAELEQSQTLAVLQLDHVQRYMIERGAAKALEEIIHLSKTQPN